MTILEEMGKKAKEAARTLAVMGEEKNDALKLIAKALIDNTDAILAANKIDVDNGRANGLTESIIDRLSLSKTRIEGMAQGVLDVVALPDPIGAVLSGSKRPNGLNITKVRVPIGVIGIIFEARPNVTSDAASLCLKSGNTVILRGGKEAINSNKCIADIMRSALEKSALDKNCIQLIEDTTRQSSVELMGLVDYLDLLIPRGGAGLIKAVVENAKVPVIETGVGNCHVFVDESADIDMAANIIYNAKTSRPSVCNAIETILVHKNIAEKAQENGIIANFKLVDTCSAEFEAKTPYYYSSYDDENESIDSKNPKKIMVLGSGPIRIGQGIEFDYCSVHSVLALKKLGYETIIVNNNPETVSTDFDIADKLYFEPLTPEDVENIVNVEHPYGAIVQFGGQTAIKLTKALHEMGVKILGTGEVDMDRSEDRELFDEALEHCKILRPKGETVYTAEEAKAAVAATVRRRAVSSRTMNKVMKKIGFIL